MKPYRVNRPPFRFRYYPLSAINKSTLEYAEVCTDEELTEEEDRLKRVSDNYVAKWLPREFWREGEYFISPFRLKKRNHVSELCRYNCFLYYNQQWYIYLDYLEDPAVNHNFPQPKVWEGLTKTPRRYLNKTALAVLDYWKHELHLRDIRRDCRLSNYHYWKDYKEES